jgi:hypothetical protein
MSVVDAGIAQPLAPHNPAIIIAAMAIHANRNNTVLLFCDMTFMTLTDYGCQLRPTNTPRGTWLKPQAV